MIIDVHAWQLRRTDCRTTHHIIHNGEARPVVNTRHHAARWFAGSDGLRANGSAPGRLAHGVELVVGGERLEVVWCERDALVTLVDI